MMEDFKNKLKTFLFISFNFCVLLGEEDFLMCKNRNVDNF